MGGTSIDIVGEAGRGVLAGADPLTSFMFFVILTLLGALAVLYKRNQKQNDDTVQLVKETSEVNRKAAEVIAVLSERIQNALNAKG